MTTKVLNGLDLQSQRIQNVADPSTSTDAANKGYVDNVAAGIHWKAPVRAATTTNGTLATAFANGQSIDGITLATGDRILIKNQTAASENGIYIVAVSGAPTRASDADTNGELAPGTAVTVIEGTANADKSFLIVSDVTIVIGTTDQTWGAFNAGTTYTSGNGINVAGSVISAVAGTGVVVNGSGINVDTSVVARKYSANIGNGALTSIAVTHSLGTKDITVAVRQNSDDAMVLTDWVATDINNVTLTFAVAPASNALRVTVTG